MVQYLKYKILFISFSQLQKYNWFNKKFNNKQKIIHCSSQFFNNFIQFINLRLPLFYKLLI